MNAEDMMLAKEMKRKRKRDEGTSSNHDKKKETQSVRQTIGKKKELLDKKPRFNSSTPLIMQLSRSLCR